MSLNKQIKLDSSPITIPNFFKVIHISLILLLAWVAILFVMNSDLLMANNYLTQGIKFISNITIYKPLIVSFSSNKDLVDVYLSSIYLIIIVLFLNLYMASRFFKNIHMHEDAFKNRDSFSGVISTHIYSILSPPLYSHGAYKKYLNVVSGKTFDDFLVEQLDNKGTKSYFLSFIFFGYFLLPTLAIYLVNDSSVKLINFWLVSLLMIYCQVKVLFESALFYKALTNKERN